MNALSSKRANALAITKKTKDAVYERDGGRCVWCRGASMLPALPEAHFIPRSKGGLGIPENILTLCRKCHDQFDHGTAYERNMMRIYFREYLKRMHKDWNEEKLIYHKEDY